MQDTLYEGTEPSLEGEPAPIGEVHVSLSKKQLTITTRANNAKGEKTKAKRGRVRTRSPDRLDSGSEEGERAAENEVQMLSMS